MIAERVLMGLLLGGIAVGCMYVLNPFVSSILWAAILVFSTWPLHQWIRHHITARRQVAALIMVVLTAVVVVLPIGLAVPGSADDVGHLRDLIEDGLRAGLPDAPEWVFDIPLVGPTLGALWTHWAADITALFGTLQPYLGAVAEGGIRVLLGVANGVLMFLLALFIAFFFYSHAEPLAERVRLILRRIAGDQADRLIVVTGQTVRGTVYGILGTAIVQGILTTLGLWVSGIPRPMLLGAIAGLISVLPIGAPVIWIPAAFWLMGSGHTGWGIFLALWGVFAISGSDSVIRPWFISRGARLPFLVTVLGVLGGALAFGLLGIFLGPVLLGVGFTLVEEWARPPTPDTRIPALRPAEPASGREGHALKVVVTNGGAAE